MTDPYCLKCKKYTINKNSRFSNNFNGELMLPTCHGVCNSKKNRQKQPYIGALKKRCFENIPQIYRRTSMPKCDFNEVLCNFIEIALWHGCSPVNLLHIFRTPFPRNTSGWLLLNICKPFISVMQCGNTPLMEISEDRISESLSLAVASELNLSLFSHWLVLVRSCWWVESYSLKNS